MSTHDAQENWLRYQYARDRGHLEYMSLARICENMYLGGGRQWSPEDRKILEAQKRPAYEFNEIMPAINAAIGYQIQNRMDISYKPRGQGDTTTALILSKIAMQIADSQALHWKETQVYSDGLIQQRGYYDIRMDFSKNVMGDIKITFEDPLDVVPDPDAKSYDPDDWSDVITTRWMTEGEIEAMYGKKAAKLAAETNADEEDFGSVDGEDVERNKFGTQDRSQTYYDSYTTDKKKTYARYRVIERQIAEHNLVDCLIHAETGDVFSKAVLSEQQLADLISKGSQQVKRVRKQIRWIVSTCDVELHNEISPYEFFTKVPFFAYFRRGQTAGMVDNAIGPQEALNKAVSQFIHIVNTSANSGWTVEENSLTNMTTEELQINGAKTGLVIEYKKSSTPPQKIQANQVPQGVDRMIDRATAAIKSATVPDAMRGVSENSNESGVLYQSKQFAAQQGLAVPLDNLSYTRHMLAKRKLSLIQRYYDSYRVFRITETDPITGKKQDTVLEINKFDPETGTYFNDVTLGQYDAVITEVPMQVTFENSQFEQAMEMREKGIAIPDPVVIRYSNLADKNEVIEQMQAQQAPADPEKEAKAALMAAQTKKVEAETTAKKVETQYSGIQTAQVIATVPQTAGLADSLLRSAGYEDMDVAPIYPEVPQGLPTADLPSNTNPLTPANPAVGMNQGIETAALDGINPQ
jgi:hypothetical protein